jgi:hypothetical protein
MPDKKNYHGNKLFAFILFFFLRSSEKSSLSSIIPVCLPERKITSRPYMTMIIDFLKRLIPAIVITVSCMVLFVFANGVYAAITICVIVSIGSWNISTNKNNFENIGKLIPPGTGLFFYISQAAFANDQPCGTNLKPYLQKINTVL